MCSSSLTPALILLQIRGGEGGKLTGQEKSQRERHRMRENQEKGWKEVEGKETKGEKDDDDEVREEQLK